MPTLTFCRDFTSLATPSSALIKRTTIDRVWSRASGNGQSLTRNTSPDRNRRLIVARGRNARKFQLLDRSKPCVTAFPSGWNRLYETVRILLRRGNDARWIVGLRLVDLIGKMRGNLTRSRSREIQSANNRNRKVVLTFFEPFPDCRC